MALKYLETALTQLSDDILHSSVYHVLRWSCDAFIHTSSLLPVVWVTHPQSIC
jgi:hypothetical protein